MTREGEVHNEAVKGTVPWWVRLEAEGASPPPHPHAEWEKGVRGSRLKGSWGQAEVAAAREGKSRAPFDFPCLQRGFRQGRNYSQSRADRVRAWTPLSQEVL